MAEDDDILAMLSTSDDTFSDGSTPSPCFLSSFDDLVSTDSSGGSQQTVRRTTAIVRASDYPNLTEDSEVTVNDTAYVVLNARLIQDGRMLSVDLQIDKGQ
jgi:hypothetical protein